MISYELAKKLKENGFPQEYRKSSPIMDWAYYIKSEELHLLHEDNDTNWWIGNGYGEVSDLTDEYVLEKFTKCTTLSELIEACGEDFIGLDRCDGVSDPSKKAWKAIAYKGDTFVYHISSTPEEAVANLWLELNKK